MDTATMYHGDDYSPSQLDALADGGDPYPANDTDEATTPWPDLVPLDGQDLPRLPADVLPGWAGQFATALATATETPLELAVGMVLAAAAVPCARRLRVMVAPGHFEPCNLWLSVSLPPGNRKSAVHSAACRPLLNWERERSEAMAPDIAAVESENKTLAARIATERAALARVKETTETKLEIESLTDGITKLEAKITAPPKAPQLWTSDATPERLGSLLADHEESMAWLSSEGGVFDMLAGRYSKGAPNLDLVLKAWSGDPERVDRGSRPPVFLQCPRLTIGLSPQPDLLRGLSSQPGFRGRGLLGRFLYLLPPSLLGYRTLRADREGASIPDGVLADYEAGLRAMLNWKPDRDPSGGDRPHLLTMEKAAYEEWLNFALRVEDGMKPGGAYEGITDLAGKVPGGAARIAAVLHGIQHAHASPWEAKIEQATMEQALDIAAVCLTHGLAAMDLMGADPTIAAARTVWTWIERGRHRQSAVRDVFNALRGTFPRVSSLNVALEALEERGYIRVTPVPKAGGTAGRPKSPSIVVRPDFVETWK